MHKTTILLAIIAFFSVSYLIEDFFQSNQSNSSSNLQANSSFFEVKEVVKGKISDTKVGKSLSQIQAGEEVESDQATDEKQEGFFSDFLKKDPELESSSSSNTQESTNALTTEQVNKDENPNFQYDTKSKLEKYFAAIDIEDLEISLDESQGKIFDVIDTSSLTYTDIKHYIYQKEASLMAKASEVTFDDTMQASHSFTYIEAVAKSFAGIEINKNNQFQNSFYINNPSKPFQVNLVVQDQNKVYCFSYHTDLHEKFKGFYDILL